jgi:hypothetical protein
MMGRQARRLLHSKPHPWLKPPKLQGPTHVHSGKHAPGRFAQDPFELAWRNSVHSSRFSFLLPQCVSLRSGLNSSLPHHHRSLVIVRLLHHSEDRHNASPSSLQGTDIIKHLREGIRADNKYRPFVPLGGMVHKRRVDFGSEVDEKRIIAILRAQEINGFSGMNGPRPVGYGFFRRVSCRQGRTRVAAISW